MHRDIVPLHVSQLRAGAKLRCLEVDSEIGEARRIVKPGGLIIIAAISRWSPRLASEVVARLANSSAFLSSSA